jgi:hypothetical protein
LGDPCRSEFARTPALAGWPLDDLTPSPENLTCKKPLNRLTLRPAVASVYQCFLVGGFAMDRRGFFGVMAAAASVAVVPRPAGFIMDELSYWPPATEVPAARLSRSQIHDFVSATLAKFERQRWTDMARSSRWYHLAGK